MIESNYDRARCGEEAVKAGCPDARHGNGVFTDIGDALTNIFHFCDEAGVDVEAVLGRAHMHHDAERDEDGQLAVNKARFPDPDGDWS